MNMTKKYILEKYEDGEFPLLFEDSQTHQWVDQQISKLFQTVDLNTMAANAGFAVLRKGTHYEAFGSSVTLGLSFGEDDGLLLTQKMIEKDPAFIAFPNNAVILTDMDVIKRVMENPDYVKIDAAFGSVKKQASVNDVDFTTILTPLHTFSEWVSASSWVKFNRRIVHRKIDNLLSP